MLKIVQAESPEQVAAAREMIEEYAVRLGVSLCFQGFEEEMRTLPGKYAPPAGRLLLALMDEKPTGVIALRPLGDNAEGVCEMKRLFVRPDFRGHRIGRVLAERIIAEAAEIGYKRMRLDTMPGKMDSAIAMYRELGFTETAPYYETPVGQTLFLELGLKHEHHAKK
ncbi:MAG TPA: GNAT family N-acetyltransferase [Candidatus Angelobacter sp.]|nr:GNAT family N-acetyltransferase [Candidatus Angelobacter sp.]